MPNPSQPQSGAPSRDDTTRGWSLSGLGLRGATFGLAHDRLLAAGFDGRRIPVSAPCGRDGAPQVLVRAEAGGGAVAAGTARDDVAFEVVYAHPDGGIVRLFPADAIPSGWGPGAAFARMSVARPGVVAAPVLGIDGESYAVSEKGLHLAKTPASRHAVRAPGRARHARTVLRAWRDATRVPIVGGDLRALAALPLVPNAIGFALGRTLVPADDFDAVAGAVERLARAGRGAVHVTRDAGGLTLRFDDGDAAKGDGGDCAARLRLSSAYRTVAIEPIGVDASVARLGELLDRIRDRFSFRIFDDATGVDLTELVHLFPSELTAPSRVRNG